MTKLRTAGVIAAALVLAGCTGEHFSLLGKPRPVARAAPKVAMTGRWMLAAADGPACGMRFKGTPGGQEGTIAPEGGCPGDFFTSRHWAFEKNSLVIMDHKSAPLAHLTFENGKFEGKAVTGTLITLSR